MIKFDVKNRFTSAVQFTADIDCAKSRSTDIKLGFAVKWAIKIGADLGGADLGGADLRGADLGGAYLRGADLGGADLGGADLGDQWVIQGPVRSDGWFFFLMNLKGEGVRVKAGCRNFTIAQARAHWTATREGTPLGDETFAILDCLEAMAKARRLDIGDK